MGSHKTFTNQTALVNYELSKDKPCHVCSHCLVQGPPNSRHSISTESANSRDQKLIRHVTPLNYLEPRLFKLGIKIAIQPISLRLLNDQRTYCKVHFQL